MATPTDEEELQRRAAQYNPELERRTGRGWALGLLLVIVIVATVAATLGVVRWRSVQSAALPVPRLAAADVSVAHTVGESALLLVGAGGAYNQIKLASTTTDAVMVQDLTRGRSQVFSAALAPQKDRLAYVREEGGHTTAGVIELATGNSIALEAQKLSAAAEGATLLPCSEGPVSWSPNSKRFCFLACDRNTSVLVVVEAEAELTPIVIKATRSPQEPLRQVFWLNDESLLYTHADAATKHTLVSRVDACSDCAPLSVYGE
jgi:hypothetical protein